MKTYSSYNEYLNSEEWQNRRMKILIRDKFQCQMCGSAKQLRVHHIRYPGDYGQYGQELDEDLVTLCDSCHQMIHEQDEINKKEYQMYVEHRRREREKKRIEAFKQSREYKWANEVKYRDFIYGGFENMCSLNALKSDAAIYAENHGGGIIPVSRIQWDLGSAHRRLVRAMYRAQYTEEQIYLLTILDKPRIHKAIYGTGGEENEKTYILDYDEITSQINQFLEDCEGKQI